MVGRAVETMERSMATRSVVTQTDTNIIQNRQSFLLVSSTSPATTVLLRSRDDNDDTSLLNNGLGSGEWCKVQQHSSGEGSDAAMFSWLRVLDSGE